MGQNGADDLTLELIMPEAWTERTTNGSVEKEVK
jgi:hypothetical protein